MHLPKQMWDKKLGEVVTLLKRGHFPDTAVVMRQNGQETEVYIKDLEVVLATTH